MAQQRLDIDFGPMLDLIEQEAATVGLSRGAMVRQIVQDGLALRASLKAATCQAALDLARAIAPDERDDPADDEREPRAIAALAVLLGSQPAAEGIAEALSALWAEIDALARPVAALEGKIGPAHRPRKDG